MPILEAPAAYFLCCWWDEADNFPSPLHKDEVILGVASKERVNSNRQFIMFHSASIFGHAVCYYSDPTREEVWFLGYPVFLWMLMLYAKPIKSHYINSTVLFFKLTHISNAITANAYDKGNWKLSYCKLIFFWGWLIWNLFIKVHKKHVSGFWKSAQVAAS